MSDLQKKLNKVISDIEKNLKNKEDLEYVKTQIYNIYTIFLDEFDELESKCNEKMENILIKCKVLDDRMSEIEDSIDKIESDIYIKENEEFDFDVTCPSEGPQNSVICPECNNVVELDWNDGNEGCLHDCHECGGECGHDHEEDNEDDM